jgi:hypothetical protein
MMQFVIIKNRNKKSKIIKRKGDDAESGGYVELEYTNTDYNYM